MLRLRLRILCCAILSVVVPALSLAPSGGATTTKSRRKMLGTLLSVGASSLIGTTILQPTAAEAAIDVSSLKTNTGTENDTTIFLGGTYTDPQNHPGGTRSIELSGTGFAGYRLVTVKGGGGLGEPAAYELPGMIFTCPGNNQRGGKQCISIDFSPKGGPRDFQGYWDEEKKGIRFVLDNNFWPKQ